MPTSLHHIIQEIAANQTLSQPQSAFHWQNLPATEIVQLKAQDNDTGRNGLLTYGILSGDTLKFRIDEATGILYSTASFDYEEEPTEYQVCFKFLKPVTYSELFFFSLDNWWHFCFDLACYCFNILCILLEYEYLKMWCIIKARCCL